MNPFSVLDPSNKDFLTPAHCSTPIKSKHSNNLSANNTKIVSVNVNGLRGKSLHMQDLIFETSANVVLCQETKLDPSVYSSELFPTYFIMPPPVG